MIIIRSIKHMFYYSQDARLKGKSLGFVPTMGALHNGHLSLIKKANQENDLVVVSIFVNPAQFGPEEDFKKYPRTLKNDALLCCDAGVDVIFCPDADKMYSKNYKTYITVNDLGDSLCGKSRPGHFQGVATVVAKLFNIVQPEVSYFGQKDAQQVVIIKKMVSDLNIPVEIRVLPVLREKDGLALSSRNTYLSAKERQDALVLSEALNLASVLLKNKTKEAAKIICAMRALIEKKKLAKIDYIAIVDAESLKPVKKITDKCLIASAVWVGKTRLIDNLLVESRE